MHLCVKHFVKRVIVCQMLLLYLLSFHYKNTLYISYHNIVFAKIAKNLIYFKLIWIFCTQNN